METITKNDLEELVELVVDMYSLRDSYGNFTFRPKLSGGYHFDWLEVYGIEKLEKSVCEKYPKFKDIERVDSMYNHMCWDAKKFYNSKAAQVLRLRIPRFVINYFGPDEFPDKWRLSDG